MKKAKILLIAILAIVSACTIESTDVNEDGNLEYLKQRIYCSNYMMDFIDSSENVGFDRDGVISVDEVHFSANNKNMYYEYLAENEFEVVESLILLLDHEGGELASKTLSMANNEEYALFAYGAMGQTGDFAPNFAALKFDTELDENGESSIRFAHFNPNYDSIKVKVGEEEFVLEFGEVSEQVSFIDPSAFAYDVYGRVNNNYVAMHSMNGYNYTKQNNHIFIFSLEGQAGGDNMVYKLQEIQ
ncbi:MAG TPA: hypothetical protein VFC87_06775 [Perlabentimonas sp.]|nr:hypothetical protein [Perlabentimonas sp.]